MKGSGVAMSRCGVVSVPGCCTAAPGSNPARQPLPSPSSAQENPGAGKQWCRFFQAQQQEIPAQQQACQPVTKDKYCTGDRKLQNIKTQRVPGRAPKFTNNLFTNLFSRWRCPATCPLCCTLWEPGLWWVTWPPRVTGSSWAHPQTCFLGESPQFLTPVTLPFLLWVLGLVSF